MSLRLLCITAHPDDESGGFGGALMTAHLAGAETSVLCLTEGQAASNRGTAQTNEELAEIRRAEFFAACKVLEVTHGEVMSYPDGRLAEQCFYSLTAVLVEKIRTYRPQVVMTFGGEGGANLHRDHTMVSAVTTAAFHWAGRAAFFAEQLSGGLSLATYAPQKLYYQSTPFLVTRNEAEAPFVARAPWSLEIDLGDWSGIKIEAFSQHTTQISIVERVRGVYEQHMQKEHYLLAASRVIGDVHNDKSLFDGVVED